MVALRLAIADFSRTVMNPKTWVLMLLTIFFFWDATLPMRGLAEQYQMGVTPFMYPVFMTEWRGRMYALVLIVMMLGEAPYRNGAEVFTNMRISRYKWITGKLVYVLMFSTFFQVAMMIISVLVCMPYVGINSQWGDIIRTYVKSTQGNISALGVVNSEGIIGMKPVSAMSCEFVLMVLISVIIALIILIINGVLNNVVGNILVGSVIIMDLYVEDIRSVLGLHIDSRYILPTTWIDLNTILNVEYLSFSKCVIFMLLIIALLVAFTYILVGKRVIKPVTNV